MERYIIALDEHGTLHVPDVSATAIWMNEPELMELFGVVALTLRAAIKAVYKSGIPNPAKRNVVSAKRTGTDGRAVRPPVGHCPSFRLHTCGAKTSARTGHRKIHLPRWTEYRPPVHLSGQSALANGAELTVLSTMHNKAAHHERIISRDAPLSYSRWPGHLQVFFANTGKGGPLFNAYTTSTATYIFPMSFSGSDTECLPDNPPSAAVRYPTPGTGFSLPAGYKTCAPHPGIPAMSGGRSSTIWPLPGLSVRSPPNTGAVVFGQ